MKKRPLYFKLLATLFYLMPVTIILSTGFKLDLNGTEYWALIQNTISPQFITQFWLIPFVAGSCLLLTNSVSFYLFLISQAATLFGPYIFDRYFPQTIYNESMFFSTAVQIIAFFSIVYIVLNLERHIFFDKKIRWWKAARRYQLPLSITLKHENKLYDAEIKNISRSGILFTIYDYNLPSHEFNKNIVLNSSISFQNFEITVPIKIARADKKERNTYGAKFSFQNLAQIITVYRFVNLISKMRILPRHRTAQIKQAS